MTDPISSSAHWDGVWRERDPRATSWFQQDPEPCLSTVRRLSDPGDHIVVVGAGRTSLVAPLLAAGRAVTAIDISALAVEGLLDDMHAAGLGAVRHRVDGPLRPPRPGEVVGLVADVASLPPLPAAAVWHDRAVLHFLVAVDAQRAYAAATAATVRPDGHLVLDEFAPDGPERCSGLPVTRHSAEEVAAFFSPQFDVVAARRHDHTTPDGRVQHFLQTVLRRRGRGRARERGTGAGVSDSSPEPRTSRAS